MVEVSTSPFLGVTTSSVLPSLYRVERRRRKVGVDYEGYPTLDVLWVGRSIGSITTGIPSWTSPPLLPDAHLVPSRPVRLTLVV